MIAWRPVYPQEASPAFWYLQDGECTRPFATVHRVRAADWRGTVGVLFVNGALHFSPEGLLGIGSHPDRTTAIGMVHRMIGASYPIEES